MSDRKPTAAELADRFENEAILMRAQALKFLLFTLHPVYNLRMIVATPAERDAELAKWKATYPTVPVYWSVVQQG